MLLKSNYRINSLLIENKTQTSHQKKVLSKLDFISNLESTSKLLRCLIWT